MMPEPSWAVSAVEQQWGFSEDNDVAGLWSNRISPDQPLDRLPQQGYVATQRISLLDWTSSQTLMGVMVAHVNAANFSLRSTTFGSPAIMAPSVQYQHLVSQFCGDINGYTSRNSGWCLGLCPQCASCQDVHG